MQLLRHRAMESEHVYHQGVAYDGYACCYVMDSSMFLMDTAAIPLVTLRNALDFLSCR